MIQQKDPIRQENKYDPGIFMDPTISSFIKATKPFRKDGDLWLKRLKRERQTGWGQYLAVLAQLFKETRREKENFLDVGGAVG